MENFFNNSSNEQKNIFAKPNYNDDSLDSQYDDLKNNYQKIFIEAAESIRKELDAFKPENPCSNCTVKDCKIEKKERKKT